LEDSGPEVPTEAQGNLIETFETSRPANALFCHQDFLEKLALHSRDAVGKRAAFLPKPRPSVPPISSGDG
jgi:hypothetical protein